MSQALSKCLKQAKLESAYSFTLKYSKITVWQYMADKLTIFESGLVGAYSALLLLVFTPNFAIEDNNHSFLFEFQTQKLNNSSYQQSQNLRRSKIPSQNHIWQFHRKIPYLVARISQGPPWPLIKRNIILFQVCTVIKILF